MTFLTEKTARLKPALWLLLLWLLPVFAHAQQLPQRPNPPRLVNDFGDMLSPQEEAQLERKLIAYDDSTSTQITVVTLANLDGNDISDYAFKLGDKWGIGRAQKNNGILLLISRDDRLMWIATGYGMESFFPDMMVKRVIDNVITPNFKQGRFYEGIDQGTDAIIQVASGQYKGEPRAERQHTSNSFPLWAVILLIILIFWFLNRINRGGGGKTIGGRRSRGFGGPIFWPMGGGMFGGGGGFGGGGFGGGGGGFGGFGGGKFGGGGAGGSW